MTLTTETYSDSFMRIGITEVTSTIHTLVCHTVHFVFLMDGATARTALDETDQDVGPSMHVYQTSSHLYLIHSAYFGISPMRRVVGIGQCGSGRSMNGRE